MFADHLRNVPHAIGPIEVSFVWSDVWGLSLDKIRGYEFQAPRVGMVFENPQLICMLDLEARCEIPCWAHCSNTIVVFLDFNTGIHWKFRTLICVSAVALWQFAGWISHFGLGGCFDTKVWQHCNKDILDLCWSRLMSWLAIMGLGGF